LLDVQTKEDVYTLLRPYTQFTFDWVQQQFPTQAAPRSDGRQAIGNDGIAGMKIVESEDGEFIVAAYVVSKMNKKRYWCTLSLHEDSEEYEFKCHCPNKYVILCF